MLYHFCLCSIFKLFKCLCLEIRNNYFEEVYVFHSMGSFTPGMEEEVELFCLSLGYYSKKVFELIYLIIKSVLYRESNGFCYMLLGE